MPAEERFITFNLNEIYKSIVIKCTHDDVAPPPKGELTSITLDENSDQIHVNLKKDDGSEEKLSYEQKFFALALVFYCQGSGIPLPNRGQKNLKILDDKIIMKIDLESSYT